MVSFWTNHGTKLLGYVLLIVNLLAGGSVAVPPPLDAYSKGITAWAVFLNVILGAIVIQRGQQNTGAIAAKVVQIQQPVGHQSALPPVIKMLFLGLLISPMLLLHGCANTPTSVADTFNKLVLAAGTVDDTALNTIKSLYDTKVITKTQATQAESVVDKIQAAVVLANTSFAAGNQSDASSKLAAAAAAIAQTQLCLAGPSANLDTCLQGVKTP
jgi:hypothetical protein